jgi:hypothetical protein
VLTNLIPDASTDKVWVCRPAAVRETDFTGFNTPGIISVLKIIGTRAYGMIGSARNAGKDEPFCYDFATAAFVTISNVTDPNTPTTQPAVGAWTPPTMDLVGSKLIVTHPGFSGGGGFFFGYINLVNPAAPSWNAGNTGGAVPLPAVPSAVRQFNGRAWYIVNLESQPAVVASDSLDALTVTSGDQVLTFGDNTPLTALGALSLKNQFGGIIQALMVFKGAVNIYQVTGDFTTNDLLINALNISTGSYAQNSLCSTPKGLAFLSPEGMRMIDLSGIVSDPIGAYGKGVTIPFIHAEQPTRVCASSNGTVMRITTQNAAAAGSPFQEWWYDFVRNAWSGPHDFPASQIQAFGTTFIMAPQEAPGGLWSSDTVQQADSVFVENGVSMGFTYQTCMLPDTDWMSECNLQETRILIAHASSDPPFVAQALDQDDAILNTYTITPIPATTLWGQFNWGQASWQTATQHLHWQGVFWSAPVVFQRLAISVTGLSSMTVQLSRLQLRYEKLGYLVQTGLFA